MTDINLLQRIQKIRQDFLYEIEQVKSSQDLETVRISYAGRKGSISELFKMLGSISPDDRKRIGQMLNELKQFVLDNIEVKEKSLQNEGIKQQIDVTLPGEPLFVGRLHPLTQVLREIKNCFERMGFSIEQGPEVETEYYNFEALNIPKGHPARDMQDTLFVDDEIVLRTHTSPVQVHVMESQPPPIRIIAPGRCYRRDTPDASHSPFFHQVEGLCVDKEIGFADLKGIILTFAQRMFGSNMKIRFRPSFFPFTEPSAEYDFSCLICNGRGCRVCKGNGWVEISGAGMVNPAVFEYVGY
ncbi:phenylalanine--tRNA ligase subunit alpha, partial [bacterium]